MNNGHVSDFQLTFKNSSEFWKYTINYPYLELVVRVCKCLIKKKVDLHSQRWHMQTISRWLFIFNAKNTEVLQINNKVTLEFEHDHIWKWDENDHAFAFSFFPSLYLTCSILSFLTLSVLSMHFRRFH